MNDIITPQTPKTVKLLPTRQTSSDYRSREHLSVQEINRLCFAAKNTSHHGHRDDTFILMMFRHGLRNLETTYLKWEQLKASHGSPS